MTDEQRDIVEWYRKHGDEPNNGREFCAVAVEELLAIIDAQESVVASLKKETRKFDEMIGNAFEIVFPGRETLFRDSGGWYYMNQKGAWLGYYGSPVNAYFATIGGSRET